MFKNLSYERTTTIAVVGSRRIYEKPVEIKVKRPRMVQKIELKEFAQTKKGTLHVR